MTLVSGLHVSNAPISHVIPTIVGKEVYTLNAPERDLICAGNFKGAKLMVIESCKHTTTDALLLQAQSIDAVNIVVRVYDSRHMNGDYWGFPEYGQAVASVINSFYREAGCRVFQIDNEPNWQWTRQGFGPYQFRWFMSHALEVIRGWIPRDVVLVCPPLSWSPALWRHDPPNTPPNKRQNPTDFILDEWLECFDFTDHGKIPSFWKLFDRVSANAYYQKENQLDDPSYGRCYQPVHEHSGFMDVDVLEWASSAHLLVSPEGKPVYTPHEVEVLRTRQYPEWLRAASSRGYVRTAFSWISSGATIDWAGFYLTNEVASAMSMYL